MVSDSQKSCTMGVQVGERFTLQGQQVALIDTPGFDNTETSDTEISQLIITFLDALWVWSSNIPFATN
jgi:predicted GTPase